MKILSAILIIIALAFSFFYTYDRLYVSDITDLQRDAELFEEKLEESEMARARQQSLIAEYEKISEIDRERIVKMAPDRIDGVRLATDITNLLSSSGVQINSVSFPESSSSGGGNSGGDAGEAPTSGAVSPVPISFNVTSGYNSFISLLRDIERSLRIIDVTNIAFSAGEEGDIFTYTISGYIYELSE